MQKKFGHMTTFLPFLVFILTYTSNGSTHVDTTDTINCSGDCTVTCQTFDSCKSTNPINCDDGYTYMNYLFRRTIYNNFNVIDKL